MNLVVAIPCLNEEKTIGKVIESVPKNFKSVDKISILVVDDGSTDETSSIASLLGANVIKHGSNKGLGIAFQSAVEWTLKNRGDLLVTIDGDGQFNVGDIENLIHPIINGDADFVTASRFLNKSYAPEGIPPIKLWGNRQMAKIISSLTGGSFCDVACGFRAYSQNCLLNLNLFGRFTYTQEVFLDLSFKKFRICEVPSKVSYFKDRKSRMASSLVKYAYNTSKIICRAYLSYYPLRFFWKIAGGLFVLGFFLQSLFLLHFLETGRFTGYLWAGFSGAFILGISLFMFILGLVVDMLDRMRVNQERILALIKQQKFH